MTSDARNQTKPKAKSIERGVSVSSGSVGGRPASGGRSLAFDEKGLARLDVALASVDTIANSDPGAYNIEDFQQYAATALLALTRLRSSLSAVSGEGPTEAEQEAYRALENVNYSHDGEHNLKWANRAKDILRAKLSGVPSGLGETGG